MSILTKRERELRLSIKQKGEEIIVRYVNKRGLPITIRTRKGGMIHRLWLEEQRRRQAGMEPLDSGVIELKEGDIIEVGNKPTGVMRQGEHGSVGRPLVEVFAEEASPNPVEKTLSLEDKKELAGIQWRLDGLRHQLNEMFYCEHDKGICTGECKVREEIRDLEKQALRDP